MTRKDFVKLAELIKLQKNMRLRKLLAKDIGNLCQSKNSNFDWKIWNQACDVA